MSQHESLILKFLSTDALDWGRLSVLATNTAQLAGSRRLSGEWTTDTSDTIRPIEDLVATAKHGMPNWIGCLTMVFGDGAGISGRWDLLRVPRDHAKSAASGSQAGYRTHEFTLEIAGSRRVDRRLGATLFSYFVEAASLLNVQFALGHDDCGVAPALHSGFGLESGLPGVYRMTAFGPKFVELIGLDRFRGLPVARCETLRGGGVAIQVDDDLTLVQSQRIAALQEDVRQKIGADYFTSSFMLNNGLSQLGGGQVGLMSFVRALLAEKRDAESEDRLAKRRPTLDWTGVFAE